MPAVVVLPGESKSVSFGGLGAVFAISGEVTGGAFEVWREGQWVAPLRALSHTSW